MQRLQGEKVYLFLEKAITIKDYEYCLVNCPSAAESVITFNACLVADVVLIPLLNGNVKNFTKGYGVF